MFRSNSLFTKLSQSDFFAERFIGRFALCKYPTHEDLANVFFPDGVHFFCLDLFYHVIKQESETGKCNMRKNDHLKIAWVNVFTESPQQLFLNSCELCKFVNEASLTLVFVSACIDCPDFLSHIIKDEDANFITMFLSSRYLTYQDAF